MTDIVGLKREKTVCFTGHRVQKLPWCSNESDERCVKMKETLRKELEKAIMKGYNTFLCGMALGFDIKVKGVEPATVLDGGFPPDSASTPLAIRPVFPSVVSLPSQKSARPKLLRTPARQFSRDLCRGGGRFTGRKTTTTQAQGTEKSPRERRGFDSLHLMYGRGNFFTKNI